jgi:hypothetical protein
MKTIMKTHVPVNGGYSVNGPGLYRKLYSYNNIIIQCKKHVENNMSKCIKVSTWRWINLTMDTAAALQSCTIRLTWLKAHFHSRKTSTDRKCSENIIVKSWKYSTSKFFSHGKFVSANHILQNFLSAENFPERKWAFTSSSQFKW